MQVIAEGECKKNGSKVVYVLEENEERYKVLTELNNRGAEIFSDFYTNRSGNARSSNTLFSARADSKTASFDKVTTNSSSDQKTESDLISVNENGIGDAGLLVHRMYGAINIDGETYRVKTTMHEFLNKSFPNTPHSYEVTKIELIESSTADASSSPLNVSTNSISAAKLLNGVEKAYDKGRNF